MGERGYARRWARDGPTSSLTGWPGAWPGAWPAGTRPRPTRTRPIPVGRISVQVGVELDALVGAGVRLDAAGPAVAAQQHSVGPGQLDRLHDAIPFGDDRDGRAGRDVEARLDDAGAVQREGD